MHRSIWLHESSCIFKIIVSIWPLGTCLWTLFGPHLRGCWVPLGIWLSSLFGPHLRGCWVPLGTCLWTLFGPHLRGCSVHATGQKGHFLFFFFLFFFKKLEILIYIAISDIWIQNENCIQMTTNKLGTLPIYLSSVLHTYQLARSLRSSSEKLLKTPRINLKSAGTLFRYAASDVWNSLPNSIRNVPTLAAFIRQLKTHLFRQAFPIS